MKRKHDLLKEKSKTRDAVGQISSWCLLIALHQRFGVGADRMERIAGDAEKLQKEIAAIIDEHGTAAGIAEMQRRLDGICLTEMRVPLNRNTKNRREVERMMNSPCDLVLYLNAYASPSNQGVRCRLMNFTILDGKEEKNLPRIGSWRSDDI